MIPTRTKFGGKTNHLVLVPVFVNGRGPVDFVLDTGAPTTVVDPDFARAAGLEPVGPARGLGAAGATSASVAELESLQVGAARVDSVRIGVVDKFGGLRAIVPSVVGTLGLDFLRHFVVDVDYVHGTIVCRNPAETEECDDAIPFSESRLLFVKALVEEQGPFEFAVDTGAAMSLVSPELVAALHLQTWPAPALFGVGGTSPNIEARSTRLTSLVVGARRFTDFDAAVAPFFDQLRSIVGVPFQGVLGYSFFEGSLVRFDFSHRTLSLQNAR